MNDNTWEDHYHEYPKTLQKVKELDEKLIPIKEHINLIAEYFNCKEFSSYSDVANWFSMAWSIKSIEYEDAKYFYEIDPYQVANSYAQHTQKLRTRLLDQITLFLYGYMGFESLINALNLPPCPQMNGKINSVKYFIKIQSSSDYEPLNLYSENLDLLKKLISKSSMNELINVFSADDCTCINGIALKVIYKIRNKLAHGNYEFPISEDLSCHMPLEPEITKVSIRLLLLTIQNIMLLKYKNNYESLFSEHLEEPDEYDFLRNLHLINRKISY